MEDRRSEGLSADAIDLVCGDARARISAQGAEAVAWRVGARDLLWSRSTAHWDRVAPVLFPCVGWSRDGRIRVDGVDYPMPVHGFAPAASFEVTERAPDRAVFELRDAFTRAHFPFSFRLRVSYALESKALRTIISVENCGGSALPYSCGLHPGFSWPFAGGADDDYAIVFEAAERPHVPEITSGGLFTRRTRPVPMNGPRLSLTPDLFTREALCFLDARSRSVQFVGPGGVIEAHAEGFRHWALWSRPGASFLCVEAWTGHGDMEDFAGDFRDKASIDLLAPGETRSHSMTLRYSDRGVSPSG